MARHLHEQKSITYHKDYDHYFFGSQDGAPDVKSNEKHNFVCVCLNYCISCSYYRNESVGSAFPGFPLICAARKRKGKAIGRRYEFSDQETPSIGFEHLQLSPIAARMTMRYYRGNVCAQELESDRTQQKQLLTKEAVVKLETQ